MSQLKSARRHTRHPLASALEHGQHLRRVRREAEERLCAVESEVARRCGDIISARSQEADAVHLPFIRPLATEVTEPQTQPKEFAAKAEDLEARRNAIVSRLHGLTKAESALGAKSQPLRHQHEGGDERGHREKASWGRVVEETIAWRRPTIRSRSM